MPIGSGMAATAEQLAALFKKFGVPERKRMA